MKLNKEQEKYIESFSIECLLGNLWWAFFNELWLYVIALLVPVINIFVLVYLCVKGREISWQNKEWLSFKQYKKRQTISLILGIVNVALLIISIAIFILMFNFILTGITVIFDSLQLIL